MKNISVIAFIIITLILLLESGCAASTNDDRINAELKSLVENKWAEYAQNITDFNGGVAMRIISPGGDYFVSAGLDDDATGNIHFRAASTTKTFTAAAILLLEQGGKLHIDDRIIFNAPGTSFPYIPDSPEYSIPYKDEITIRQLLEHRAGVFDISNTAIPDTISVDYAGKIYILWCRFELLQY